MINLASETDIQRLYTARDAAIEALAPFRRNNKEMLREYVGSYYNDSGAPFEVLINHLAMTADAYTLGLAANCPRARVTTNEPDLWSFAHRWQVAIDNAVKEMRFNEILQAIVLDAMFTIGIARTHLGDSQQLIQIADDEWADPGQMYVTRVSIHDFFWDMSCKDTRRMKFMGSQYRVSWDACKKHPAFDKNVVARLSPTSKQARGEEDANQISAGTIVDGDEYEPMIDLFDVWLPDLQSVATFPMHRVDFPLYVEPWNGPEGGPYDYLTFAEVPDNAMPVSPLQNLMGLHLLHNGLLRKQARQAKRQKTNPAYRSDAQDDATRLQKASDGEWVHVKDPSGINVIVQGGVSPENAAFSLAVLELFDRQAGNLPAMMGLGPQAPTASQEELIHRAVNRKEAKMQSRTHSFTARVLGKLGHLMWVDEVLRVPGEFEIAPGTGVFLDATWTPEMREGNFWQYNFDLQPYSMNYEPPEARLAKLEAAMDRLGGMFPVIQANGGTIDVMRMVDDYAELLGAPELKNWITFSTGPTQPIGEGMGGAQLPQSTTRNYVRRNVPTGGTPQFRSAALQQLLLGGGSLTGPQRAAMRRQQ